MLEGHRVRRPKGSGRSCKSDWSQACLYKRPSSTRFNLVVHDAVEAMHNRVVRRRKLIHWKGDNDEAAPELFSGANCIAGSAKEALHQTLHVLKSQVLCLQGHDEKDDCWDTGRGRCKQAAKEADAVLEPLLLGHRAEEMQTGCEKFRCSAGTLSNNARKCKLPILKKHVLCVFYTRWGHWPV